MNSETIENNQNIGGTNPHQCHCVYSTGLLARAGRWSIVCGEWFARHSTIDYAPIFLRLILAYEFGEAGVEKWGGENWFKDIDFLFPFNLLPSTINWHLAMGLELLTPIVLLLGIGTRFFSVALMILTVVAIAAVHWPHQWHTLGELWQGYSITDKGFGNYKLPLLYLLMLASLLCSGAGKYSIDEWLTRRRLGN